MCLAMRYVKTMVPDFAALGLPVVLKDIAESPRGIVLLAGATGCGGSSVSTTCAASPCPSVTGSAIGCGGGAIWAGSVGAWAGLGFSDGC